jgi:predicted GNAT family acetyltransferase
MPFMASTLASAQMQADTRVHQAGPDDTDDVCAVMGEAFGFPSELMVDVTASALRDASGPTKIWLLVDNGAPVSTVLTSLVEDAVTVWCMSTPERHGRKGYGRAVLAHALLEAGAAGASVGLLGATPAGKPLYDITGWTTLESWRMFANEESAQFHG